MLETKLKVSFSISSATFLREKTTEEMMPPRNRMIGLTRCRERIPEHISVGFGRHSLTLGRKRQLVTTFHVSGGEKYSDEKHGDFLASRKMLVRSRFVLLYMMLFTVRIKNRLNISESSQGSRSSKTFGGGSVCPGVFSREKRHGGA